MSDVTFHTRDDWGARPRKGTPSKISSEGITVHYGGESPWGGSNVDRSSGGAFMADTDHNRCASILRAWQDFHMNSKGWSDIAYNSAFCPHGHVYDLRGPGIRSGANGTNAGNSRSVAFVYIGGGDDPLTEPAKRAAHAEAVRFRQSLWRNHSDWKSTQCAGNPIKLWQSQGWPKPTTDTGELDITMGQYEDLKGQLVGTNMMLGFLMQKLSKVDFETFEVENGWLFDEFLTKDKPADGGPSRYELFLDGFNNAARLEEQEDLTRYVIDCLDVLATKLEVKLPKMPAALVASDTTPNKKG